jgi:dipeptidyl aminopeptidase/acylaminoacyl peptidase
MKELFFMGPRFLSDSILNHAAQIAQFNPDAVRPAEIARKIQQPLRLLHGTADQKIPIRHGEKIFCNLASRHKEWVPVSGGDHYNLWKVENGRFQKESLEFLKKWNRNLNADN